MQTLFLLYKDILIFIASIFFYHSHIEFNCEDVKDIICILKNINNILN